MTKYADVAEAVEPIIRMLDEGGCRYSSVTIFEDGSGHITIPSNRHSEADSLLRAHGVELSGCRNLHRRGDYNYYLDLGALRKYSESLCPHCGKDTEALAGG